MQTPLGVEAEPFLRRVKVPETVRWQMQERQARRVRLALSGDAPRGSRLGLELLSKEREILTTIYLPEPDPKSEKPTR